MLGFLIGTACLIGLIKTLRHGGCGYRAYNRCGAWGPGYGGCGFHGYGDFGGPGPWGRRGPWGQRGPWGGFAPFAGRGHHGYGGPFFLRAILERLEVRPEQEKVIHEAMDELRETARKHRDEIKKSRADIAKAMRSSSFDEVLLGELFSRHDTAIEALRKAFVGAMARVHDTLDERQRAQVADLIESGPFGF